MQEHDKELKILFKKVFWKMGHYSRIDVKLGSFGEPEGKNKEDIMELTDADVLGLFFDNDFRISYSTVECKNGKNISIPRLLFWIKGVMEFLGQDTKGYLTLGTVEIPPHIREIANRLDISLIDKKNLKGYIALYNPDDLNGNMFNFDAIQYVQNVKGGNLTELNNYRKYHYWISRHNTNILNIISLLKKHSTVLQANNKDHQIVATDLVTLFTISLFDLCSYVIKTNLTNPTDTTIAYLYDGIFNLKRYNKVISLMGSILEKTVDNYEDVKSMLTVVPEYYNDLIELVVRLLRRPNESKGILRYLDIIMYEGVYPNKTNKKSVLQFNGEENFNHYTYKLLTDIYDFIVKHTGINYDLVPVKLG
ncbi:hypothetical protein [Bacillus thuringiensis]|uniref:hypothetical protein n=1 Tax=Bacillus thuringiensis TaxID=1428 RepID=UPI000BF678CC|nr:hypothetical protein [Bacillus thuringiensis]PEV71262.1 hypothetical protein CN434_05165 [Bacillus thuringiensis]PGO92190.1 hypothetical protein CN990_02600 [Bacillus thuringiensis]